MQNVECEVVRTLHCENLNVPGVLGKLEGMQTLDQALADLVLRNLVTREEAMMRSSNPAKLDELLSYSIQLA